MTLLRSETIMLKGIQIPDGRMKPDEKNIKLLMESIAKIGLLEPIVVCRPANQMGAFLVAGRCRLEACRRLKLKEIAARVLHGDTPEIRQWRELAEIDENLIRRTLTPAQRAKLIGQRKKAYVLVHPETKMGGAPGKAGGGKKKAKKPESGSFVDDTALKTGKSKTVIKDDATRAAALGPDLDRVVGTSLDKGIELDALIKLPEEQRNAIIERAAAGEKVSAIPHIASITVPAGVAHLDSKWDAFLHVWRHADPEACEAFLIKHDNGKEVFGGPRQRKAITNGGLVS